MRMGKKVLKRTAGWALRVQPDRQRLINRLHMKGYCDRKGFPISISWLSFLETHIIIQKFNSVAEGMANYYCNFTSNNNMLSRWLYIIRWSCIKPLAQKFNTNVKGILKKFGNSNDPTSTRLQTSYYCEVKSSNNKIKVYKKTWYLLTGAEIINKVSKTRAI